MLIFKQKSTVADIQSALDSAIVDGESYVETTFAESDYQDSPCDLEQYRAMVKRWRSLLQIVEAEVSNPVETYVYTVADHDDATDDQAEPWSDAYVGLGKAKAEVLQDVCYRRGQKEYSITVLPTFSVSLTGYTLVDNLTRRVYTITRTTLK
jgi:ribosome-binding ATPase YchF (GTP1/OBG family)